MVNVIIHCSASKFGNAALITKWHLSRGWDTIGYHYVILNGWLSAKKYHQYFDGRIETGRPLDDDSDMEADEWGAHAKGYNNTIGICMIGESGYFTLRQKTKLYDTLFRLKEQFGELNIMQHSDVDPNKPYCAGLPDTLVEFLNVEI